MQKKLIYAVGLLTMAFLGFYLYQKFRVAPDLKTTELLLEDLSQRPVELAAFKGQKTVLCFSASWCGPCRKELAMIGKIKQSNLNDLNFVVISDEAIPVIENMKAHFSSEFTWLRLIHSFSSIGINSIPTSYLLNKKGEVVEKKVGYIDWEDPSTAQYLSGLME